MASKWMGNLTSGTGTLVPKIRSYESNHILGWIGCGEVERWLISMHGGWLERNRPHQQMILHNITLQHEDTEQTTYNTYVRHRTGWYERSEYSLGWNQMAFLFLFWDAFTLSDEKYGVAERASFSCLFMDLACCLACSALRYLHAWYSIDREYGRFPPQYFEPVWGISLLHLRVSLTGLICISARFIDATISWHLFLFDDWFTLFLSSGLTLWEI